MIRQRLEKFQEFTDQVKVFEVGSGAHGLLFGFRKGLGVGIDPLAVEYK